MTAKHIIKKSKLIKCHPEFSSGSHDTSKKTEILKQVQNDNIILALGSEFDTRLALYINNKIYFSKNTGKIAETPQDLEKFILDFLSGISASLSVIPAQTRIQSPKITPNIIITDLHPLYNSTQIGKKLAKKFRAEYLQTQHHLAHVYTAFGDYRICHPELDSGSHKILDRVRNDNITGIACDGTGYGTDSNIWGGEVFCDSKRIGHLENQVLSGNNLSIEKPARMLINILKKVYSCLPANKSKNLSFLKARKYYTKSQFEVIWNQLLQNFNCQLTSSAGRVLDATAILLGFCENTRKYKHYPIKMLEKNSLPIKKRLAPVIKKDNNEQFILQTTPLFQYLINSKTNKKELATLAQIYIIEGLYQIVKKSHTSKNKFPIFFSGGLATNKVMKNFAVKNNIYVPQKISPGDDGIAAGQIFYYLANSRDQISTRNLQFFFP